MNKLKLVIIFSIFINQSFAQIPVGSWRDHLPYRDATNLVQANEKIFCTTPYAVFFYDTEDHSINKLSITNGLSDIGTSAISFMPEKNLLVVAYSNANIDFIRANNITNINDIKQKQIQGDKNIYQIVFNEGKVYLACGFGIVKLNPDKNEVEDTYYIGTNALEVPVYSIAFDDNYIYAASDNTIYYADKDNPYLVDFNNWQGVANLPLSNAKYMNIVNFNNRILINCFNETNNKSTVYKQEPDGTWQVFYNSDTFIRRIKTSENKFFIVKKDTLFLYDINLNLIEEISDYGFANANAHDVIISSNNDICIADEGVGLIIKQQNNSFTSIAPNGPFTNHNLDIDARNDKICVAGGGRTDYWGNLYYAPESYTFQDENWQWNIIWDTDVRDFVTVLIDPQDINHILYGSWGGGIFEYKNNELINIYNEQNSSLQTVVPGELRTYIGAMVYDDEHNLWVTNPEVPEVISVKTKDDDWYSLNYTEISGKIANKIIITQYGTKWVQLARGNGLFAFNDNNTPEDISDDERRVFYAYDENGEFITKEIFSIAEDKDGVIWVGTDEGVLTYFSPENVFSGENFYADRIKLIDVNLDSLVQYLLSKETITAIAIDGANRKWFGTRNSGVYLMSEDCRSEIFHFHTGNSPLFSNTINDIAINEKTGEVFIGTPLGVVSFKGTATEGDNNYTDAYVYPNPVRENYEGNITITGLASDVNVKITDIAGRLVYETHAFGGQAIWNGKTFSGERVKTGVYLIFCTDDTGEYTKVLKLLFIN